MDKSNKPTYASMFKTTQELQDFILWCREAKIKAIKLDQMEVQFSDLAYIDSIADSVTEKALESQANSEAAVGQSEQTDDDEALFWSSNP